MQNRPLSDNDLEYAIRSYEAQKYRCDHGKKLDALGNRVEMRLTFDEWFDIWYQSGQLLNRGRNEGCYVMSRKGDLGHYEIGNVVIQTNAANVREAFCGKERTADTKKKISEAHIGKPKSEEHRKKLSDASKRQDKTVQLAAMRKANIGRTQTDETKRKISEAQIGRVFKESTTDKMREKALTRPIVRCPHCDKEGALNAMKQWHFDHCKKKPKS